MSEPARRIPLLPALLVTASALLAGCATPGGTPATPQGGPGLPVGSLTGLTAEGAEAVFEGDALVFSWKGTTGAGLADPVLGIPVPPFDWSESFTFDVNPGLQVEAQATPEGSASLTATIRDSTDGIVCTGIYFVGNDRCVTDVPASETAKAKWTAVAGAISSPPGVAFEMKVTLRLPVVRSPESLAETFDGSIRFVTNATGADGAEPTVGVTSKGTVFVIAGTSLMRSQDRGATWEDVMPPAGSVVTLDPMMRVDPHTDRVWANQLYVGCSVLAWSDDEGESWLTNPAACGLPSNDHQKLGVGATNLPVAPWDGILYYGYHEIGYDRVVVSRSLDGGGAWQPVIVGQANLDGYSEGWPTGPVEADREGNVLIGWHGRPAGIYVGVSHDHGATYKVVRVAEGEEHVSGSDPDIAFDAAGNTYAVWHGNTSAYYSVSMDHGDTWGAPVRLNPPSVPSLVFPAAVAGDEGKLVVAYYGTPDSIRIPDWTSSEAKWFVYVTRVENATTEAPTFRTSRASAADDPIQIGRICTGGSGCAGSRNLLDFIDVVLDEKGYAVVAYTDGCDGCDEAAKSREEASFVAFQVQGPPLLSLTPEAADAGAGAAGRGPRQPMGSPHGVG